MLQEPKTELQKAMNAFEQEFTDQLEKRYGVVGVTEDVGPILECLVDLRAAQAQERRAARKKNLRPGYLRHFRYEVKEYKNILDECLSQACEFEEWSAADMLKASEQVFRKILKFARERLLDLIVEEDVDFLKTPYSSTSNLFTIGFCTVICYDRGVAKEVRTRIWKNEVIPDRTLLRPSMPSSSY